MSYPNNVFLRKFIALFMALAIANPACCCALKGHTGNGKAPSCCASSSDSPDDSEKEDKPCACSFAKEKATPEQEAILPDMGPAQPLPPLIGSWDSLHLLPKLSQATTFLKKWPPGSLPTPTTAARLAAKCSYLI